MVVAVDHGTAQLGADPVEHIAECSHIGSTVFIAGDHFIDRIQNNSLVAFLAGFPDHFISQLVKRSSVSSQGPDIYIPAGLTQSHGCPDILDPLPGAFPVNFQIDIQHTSLFTLHAQPWQAFTDAHSQLQEQEGLSHF